MLAKHVHQCFISRLDEYKDKDCPERDALQQFHMAGERHMALADYLWQEGYRHGDHIMEYRWDGSFKEKVLTKYTDVGRFLHSPSDFQIWEYAHQVKPEDRTQRKSQPDYSAHEHGMIVPTKLP